MAKSWPGYTPPSRKDIAGSLLDKVYELLRGDIKEAVSGNTATLVEEGWSNSDNEPVIASCLQHTNLITARKARLLEALDRRYIVILVLLDMSAAFHTANHEIRLSHLEHRYGMAGSALAWKRSYLIIPNRSVAVCVSTGWCFCNIIYV
ncbi:hypothetical protein NP493_126g11057 [Ridgeia piscesae]|uniref:Reverse transcriptase domain-containing protein n=1 Tax=Ridgeia piscesae TaxID=27915 RepID=A0AAD9P5U0_RIDPI|nr:hypothetical protein NP493_126g11057 [Ridgeia piscesae]